jgi:hypothetical protein
LVLERCSEVSKGQARKASASAATPPETCVK